MLISGINIEEGFGLAFRIMQDFNLSASKSFGSTAKYLAGNNRLQSVEKLIDCIRSNNGRDTSFCDEIIMLAVQTAVAAAPAPSLGGDASVAAAGGSAGGAELKAQLNNLIRLIEDIGTKITCYIIGGQLKTAYLKAVEHNRLSDVRRILRKAEQSNQIYVKKLCEAKLKISSVSSSKT